MKNIWKPLLFTVLLSGSACTANYLEINSNPYQPDKDQMQADGYLLGATMSGIMSGVISTDVNTAQFTDCLLGGTQGGYFADSNAEQRNTISNYNPTDNWTNVFMASDFVIPTLYSNLRELKEQTDDPVILAIADVIKVAAMHRVTDYYGPVIYSHFADRGSEYVPDSQQQVYGCFFDDLDEAADILAAWVEEQPEAGEFSRFDLLLDGSYTAWLRFANSLRMRLAVRIAVAAPEKARAEFRKAAQAAGGVIETSMENAAVKTSGTYSNPLGEINLNWNEAALNASMESVLTGYGDPRLEKFFKPCGSDVVIAGDAGDGTVVLKGQYHGIRQGTGFSHNYYAAFSRLTVDTDTDAVLMTAAEVWFLRAEAALRGWTDEDAERCYRNGVAASFAQWQLSGAESYLGSDAMAADYHDPVDPGNDIAARCRVSPRWDATADDELKLERIITQKWIAMYPEGCEAWAEQRRTGYPRLFPVRLNHSKGYIDTETMIRRLPFPAALATSDPEQYASLVAELGGEDHGGTRLWWDAGRNF